jgi:N-glycosidase YbiA
VEDRHGDRIGELMSSSFRGQKFYLSNFYPCNVDYEGIMYPSSEHAYQAAKVLDEKTRYEMSQLIFPAAAKNVARNLKLRPFWNEIKTKIMTDIVRAKFTQNLDCGMRLVATGDEQLVEENYWGDKFWGTVKGEGENHLGLILMQVRQELRDKV